MKLVEKDCRMNEITKRCLRKVIKIMAKRQDLKPVIFIANKIIQIEKDVRFFAEEKWHVQANPWGPKFLKMMDSF